MAPTSSSRASACAGRTRANASSSCGTRLLALTLPNVPKSGSPETSTAGTAGTGNAGCGHDPDRPRVPGGAGAVADVGGVDDEPGREVEHLAGEMEVLRPVLPERRDALVEHGMAEQAPDDAALALHRVEVAVAVAAADRQPRDEMVEHEVVQHDDPGRAPQRLDDPAVSLRIVADVVDAEIAFRAAASSRRA